MGQHSPTPSPAGRRRWAAIVAAAAVAAAGSAAAWSAVADDDGSARHTVTPATDDAADEAAASTTLSPVAEPPSTHPEPPAGARPKRAEAAEPVTRPAGSPQPSTPVKRTMRVVATGACGASFYDEPQMTASGERFNPTAMTAAHKTLPLGSRVRVTNPDTGRRVTVRINDRGPYVGGRCLDLSAAAFAAIGDTGAGVMRVRYEVLAR
ncbi:MAG TPA: septal ring lytic transglycosylase RlpA family protein [Nonomuraea sp.]|nr:septal ring lytic transglycosylase RlpA family protein [Nonomuraea sp.]